MSVCVCVCVYVDGFMGCANVTHRACAGIALMSDGGGGGGAAAAAAAAASE